MWEYVIGGATVFAFIVGLFSLYNGRVTRKEIARVITEEGKETRRILEKLSEQHETMQKQLSVLVELHKSQGRRRKRG